MIRGRAFGIGIVGLAFGYFAWYIPYSALVKALSSGEVPGVDEPVGGLVLLPAAAMGQLIAMPVFLTAIGWWKYARRRTIGGRSVIWPGRTMLWASFFMSLIIAATTLNYTFIGASVLLMVLLMRGGTLMMSPVMDLIRKRQVHKYSWIALGLSLVAVVVALGDVDGYVLGISAALSVGMYLTGYAGRWSIMNRLAKTGVEEIDRRYFVEEHIFAPIFQLLLCAIPAIIGLGAWGDDLREGFTSFLTTPAALGAFAIGILYEALFIFGTMIYLDPNEYTWAVPVNRCSSLFSGLIASFTLAGLTGIARPGNAQLIAMVFIVSAVGALSWPLVRARVAARQEARRRLLFVCGGNTSRSPMAAAIAREELRAYDVPWDVASAGVSVRTPGSPLTPESITALNELGVPAPVGHESRALTPEMVHGTEAVYCMTGEQRAAVIEMAPQAAERTFCLDPSGADLPDPSGQTVEAYREVAQRLRTAVHDRIGEQRERYVLSGVEGT